MLINKIQIWFADISVLLSDGCYIVDRQDIIFTVRWLVHGKLARQILILPYTVNEVLFDITNYWYFYILCIL